KQCRRRHRDSVVDDRSGCPERSSQDAPPPCAGASTATEIRSGARSAARPSHRPFASAAIPLAIYAASDLGVGQLPRLNGVESQFGQLSRAELAWASFARWYESTRSIAMVGRAW